MLKQKQKCILYQVKILNKIHYLKINNITVSMHVQ